MRLKGMKIVIIVEDLYDVLDMWSPTPHARRMRGRSKWYQFASVYASKHGYQAE